MTIKEMMQKEREKYKHSQPAIIEMQEKYFKVIEECLEALEYYIQPRYELNRTTGQYDPITIRRESDHLFFPNHDIAKRILDSDEF